MFFNTVTVGESEFIGIANAEENGFFYPGRFYATQEEADTGMVELARSIQTEIDARYAANRKTKEDGSLAKPGRRSDADIQLYALAQTRIDELAAAQEAQSALMAALAARGLSSLEELDALVAGKNQPEAPAPAPSRKSRSSRKPADENPEVPAVDPETPASE